MIGTKVKTSITTDAIEETRRLAAPLTAGPIRTTIRRLFNESHPTARYGRWSTWRHPQHRIEFVVAENGARLTITKVSRNN